MAGAGALADMAACTALYKEMVDGIWACFTPPAKAASLGTCSSMKRGKATAAARRECAAATDCCGGVTAAAATTNQFEICYDKTKTVFDGAGGTEDSHAMWYIQALPETITKLKAEAALTNAEREAAEVKKKARTAAVIASDKAADDKMKTAAKAKKDKFGCIEGATGLIASATAVIAVSYML